MKGMSAWIVLATYFALAFWGKIQEDGWFALNVL